MKIRKLILGLILIVGLFQSESMAQINYYINSQGIPINASAVEAKQRLANGENYLGEIRAYPSTTNPSSWIRADGRLLNINQYLPLYGMLQNRYGGDGINTFAVPKLVPIDADDSTNNVNWSIGGDKLKAIGLLGSLNNYNVQFIRNNVNQFSLTSTGIVSNVDYTTSGNVTLQKGNPRLRLRDTGAGGHTNGFDLHVNGDEFLIDDNTHSRNILRNYLNSTVHTTDFDAEVFNFKNGATNFARLNATGLNLPYLTPLQLIATDAGSNIVSLGTATYPSLTELTYLKGVTSAIQTQINGKFTLPSLTSGSVLFSNGTTIAQNNAQLFWDNTNNRFGLGTTTPASLLHLRNTTGTQQFIIDDNTVRSSLQQSTQLFINGGTNVASGNVATGIIFRQSSSFTEIARFKENGNFGIGVNPSYKLDVNGTGHFTGAVLFDASVGLGTTSLTGYGFRNSRNIVGSINSIANASDGVVQSTVTSNAWSYFSNIGTQASSFTLGALTHYYATQGTIGAGSTVTNQVGFSAESNLVGATNNYGFLGAIPSGANRWNLFMNGTAQNYMAGPLAIGSNTTSVPSAILEINNTTRGVLLPRMTTTQINAIASPANGLMVYNTTLNKICVYENTAWRQVTTTAM